MVKLNLAGYFGCTYHTLELHAGRCLAQYGEVRQVAGMHHLFRDHLSKPLRQLSLPRDSPLGPHGEEQEDRTGAKCAAESSP